MLSATSSVAGPICAFKGNKLKDLRQYEAARSVAIAKSVRHFTFSKRERLNHEVLRPLIIEALGDTFPPAQLGNTVFASQAI